MAEYIFKQPGAKYLFSERLTQDPLECFFGKQRACGGRSENPSARQFLDNTVSLRVQGSAALDPVRGNCRKRKQMKESTSIDETPLPKRRRGSHTSSADLASKYCKLIWIFLIMHHVYTPKSTFPGSSTKMYSYTQHSTLPYWLQFFLGLPFATSSLFPSAYQRTCASWV